MLWSEPYGAKEVTSGRASHKLRKKLSKARVGLGGGVTARLDLKDLAPLVGYLKLARQISYFLIQCHRPSTRTDHLAPDPLLEGIEICRWLRPTGTGNQYGDNGERG